MKITKKISIIALAISPLTSLVLIPNARQVKYEQNSFYLSSDDKYTYIKYAKEVINLLNLDPKMYLFSGDAKYLPFKIDEEIEKINNKLDNDCRSQLKIIQESFEQNLKLYSKVVQVENKGKDVKQDYKNNLLKRLKSDKLMFEMNKTLIKHYENKLEELKKFKEDLFKTDLEVSYSNSMRKNYSKEALVRVKEKIRLLELRIEDIFNFTMFEISGIANYRGNDSFMLEQKANIKITAKNKWIDFEKKAQEIMEELIPLYEKEIILEKHFKV